MDWLEKILMWLFNKVIGLYIEGNMCALDRIYNTYPLIVTQ